MKWVRNRPDIPFLSGPPDLDENTSRKLPSKEDKTKMMTILRIKF